MSQVFDASGVAYPATIITAGPVTVTQIKAVETDGYAAVQVGFGSTKAEKLSKPQKGHLKEIGAFPTLKEFRLPKEQVSTLKVGDKIDLSTFAVGDAVEVSAVSKGKGFQGVVKRHGFHGGPRSHGQKHSEREPGSISGGTREGGRVPAGMRMAGRMGSDRITVKNQKIVHVDVAAGEIYIEGAVPGKRGTLVEIRG